MKRLILLLSSLRFVRMVVVLMVSVVLLLTTTACNTGNVQGARPKNPPVQMGGQNNPYKQGGDGYTQYKMSTDPTVNSDRTTNQ
ncbi:MAG: hypothetical protein Kow00121_21440 [Elainellaceae cyanobacterium]